MQIRRAVLALQATERAAAAAALPVAWGRSAGTSQRRRRVCCGALVPGGPSGRLILDAIMHDSTLCPAHLQ